MTERCRRDRDANNGRKGKLRAQSSVAMYEHVSLKGQYKPCSGPSLRHKKIVKDSRGIETKKATHK